MDGFFAAVLDSFLTSFLTAGVFVVAAGFVVVFGATAGFVVVVLVVVVAAGAALGAAGFTAMGFC